MHSDVSNSSPAALGAAERAPFLTTLEKVLGYIVEIPAAILVVAEVAVLFSGIVARYIFHKPIIWSDELAAILFLWLVMLGATIATRRNTHMRMTAMIANISSSRRAFFDTLATAAGLAFLVLIIHPAVEWAYEESFVMTPAMEISAAWRASAFPIGVGFMIAFSVLHLATRTSVRHALSSLAIIAAAVAFFWMIGPILKPLGNLNLILFFIGIVGFCVFSGIPIVFAFALATFGYIALTTRAPVFTQVGRMDEGMSHIILLAVPLFVFLGLLIEMTNMANAMVRFLANLLGHVRGGLSYVLIGAMYLVSGISGAKAADMAAVAPALFPEMKARGAPPGDLVALLAVTGAQTETIPPSIVLITIGSVTGVSIAALFTGGLLPGVVLALCLCVVVGWRYRKDDMSKIQRATKIEIWKSFWFALPALALPFLIRIAVVEGVSTATEVSTIGIVYSIIIGFGFYRHFKWERVYPMLIDTAALSGAILIIIGAASAMAWALTQSGFSRTLVDVMTHLPGGKVGFMVASIVVFIVLGSVLEGIPAVVLFGPLLFPIAHIVGINEVHYAMVVILSMGLGLFSPPFGVGYYTACAIGKVDPNLGLKPIIGYLIALVLGLIVVAAVPWISIGFL